MVQVIRDYRISHLQYKQSIMKILKFILAAIFCLGLTILFPFTSAAGLDYVKAHGKLLLFGIGIINVFVGGGISGGFFSGGFDDGFSYWFKPPIYNKAINPTHGFGAIVLVWNLIVILFFIEP
jgi:hypothetical protein